MNEINIAQRVSQPGDCTFVIGIPSSEEGYRRSLVSHDDLFAKRYGSYARYERELIRPLLKATTRMASVGVDIIWSPTLEGLASLFQEQHIHVVVLFSHWDDQHIEFWDGFASVDRIIESLPEGSRAVLDLCVCHPHELIPRLHEERNGLIIHWRGTLARPRYWLSFYSILFASLRRQPRPYIEAFGELQAELLRRTFRNLENQK